ncbi:MAG: nucleotidyltransferase substrate binding protein [Candidatus Margulisiibacteriota bacterium]|jgi:nucleotidyltransferase substrate binding protein (TIGR01987 family)
MQNKTDIRWIQRFNNFEKAFLFLESSLKKIAVSQLEEAGIVQAYEFTFELSWKTLKDFLELNQVLVQFPREIIKEAFKYDLIDNGEIWLDMLEKRNLMAHTYNETNAKLSIFLIRTKYFFQLNKLYLLLKEKLAVC